jgi:hypothetical protein
MFVEVLNVRKIDESTVLAIGFVGRSAMHFVMIKMILFHHFEPRRRKRHFWVEVLISPLGVHIRYAKESDIVVEAHVLGQGALILTHVPLAHPLGYVTMVLQQFGYGELTIQAARLAVHRRAQDAVVQRILPSHDGRSTRRTRRRRVR